MTEPEEFQVQQPTMPADYDTAQPDGVRRDDRTGAPLPATDTEQVIAPDDTDERADDEQ